MARIYALAGPSGSAKTTLGNYLREKGIEKLVSSTSRMPRIGEIDGVDYHFVDKDSFSKDKYLESTIYAGDRYGLSIKELEDKLLNHDKVYCILDQNGIVSIKEYFGDDVVTIGIKLDKDTCCQRMMQRGDSKENIEKRLLNYDQNNESEIWKLTDTFIDGNQSLDKLKQEIYDIAFNDQYIYKTMGPINGDPISVFFNERIEEAEIFNQQFRQTKNAWKEIIENPNFCSLEFITAIDKKVSLHLSSRKGVDWQLTYFDKDGIPFMHENYVVKKGKSNLGYPMEELYSKLACRCVGGKQVKVKVTMNKESALIDKVNKCKQNNQFKNNEQKSKHFKYDYNKE